LAVSPGLDEGVASRLSAVRARIFAACSRAGRKPERVRLIAVSKGHGPDSVRAAYAAGQRDFGESYAQELKQKAAALADLPELRLRFIGRLQRNKVKDVVALGCAIDGVDSLELAQRLSQRALALGRALDLLVQVNVDREPQKSGVLPEAVPELVEALRALPAVSLHGLMAIPRASESQEQMRPAFAALRALAERLSLPELSMGMSDDLEVAVEEGATMVRVGTAIFGARDR
jgi:pyridoxal phosphate enzyme (YggS family)